RRPCESGFQGREAAKADGAQDAGDGEWRREEFLRRRRYTHSVLQLPSGPFQTAGGDWALTGGGSLPRELMQHGEEFGLLLAFAQKILQADGGAEVRRGALQGDADEFRPA